MQIVSSHRHFFHPLLFDRNYNDSTSTTIHDHDRQTGRQYKHRGKDIKFVSSIERRASEAKRTSDQGAKEQLCSDDGDDDEGAREGSSGESIYRSGNMNRFRKKGGRAVVEVEIFLGKFSTR